MSPEIKNNKNWDQYSPIRTRNNNNLTSLTADIKRLGTKKASIKPYSMTKTQEPIE